MARPFDLLLSELRTVYENHQELLAFAPFCQDVTIQEIEPNPLLCGQGLAREKNEFFETQYQTLCKAVVAAGAQAHWRETYKHTKVGQGFFRSIWVFYNHWSRRRVSKWPTLGMGRIYAAPSILPMA